MANINKLNEGNNDDLIGAGFSSDSQKLVDGNRCFNSAISSTSGGESLIKLDTWLLFDQFASSMNIDFSPGSINVFLSEPEIDFYHSVQDDYLATSYNYYKVVSKTNSLSVAGYEDSILTEDAKLKYDNGENQYFNQICGDNIITSYKEGAMLLMSVKMAFYNHQEKVSFEASSGDIGAFSTDISAWAKNTQAAGKISIIAYQKGGTPASLSNIFNADSDGNYYIISCLLQDMDACVNAANGMLDYANTDFPNQFDLNTNENTTVLGAGQYEYTPTSDYNLTVSSVVTPAILGERIKLSNELTENKGYYKPLSDAIVYNYPVELSTTSEGYADALSLNEQVNNNINVLLNPNSGAIQCFDVPQDCLKTGAAIQQRLDPVTANDLGFVEQIKYVFSTGWACLYYNFEQWLNINKPSPEFELTILEMGPCYTNYTSSAIQYLTYFEFKARNNGGDQFDVFSTSEQPILHEESDPFYDVLNYTVTGYDTWNRTEKPTTCTSPWYFTLYDNDNSNNAILGSNSEEGPDYFCTDLCV
ncbi:MAG: hypothetical protein N4A31_03295 [Rickettsiales bacterium]|jgi:hypothetical protein|nr:hypothetical protein [Rickettsiales bacterium]